MPRVLVLNNYSFERVWGEVRDGDKPDHHLFGLNYFADAGYEVEIAPHQQSPFGSRMEKWLGKARFPIPLGDLSQQAFTWKNRHSFDLIYAPCQTQTHLLGYFRSAGLWRVPIICVAHHPFEFGRLAALRRPFLRANFRGTDRYPSLSRGVAEEINQLTGRAVSEVIPWGPQRDYFTPDTGPGEGAIAAGRTGRDFVTFGRAATRSGVPTRIICMEDSVSGEFQNFGRNVVVDARPANEVLGYKALMKVFASARVLAIPMFSQPSLAGLTSLTDALGMGKPVIVTRNRLLDLDVEKLGIGRWVEAGDVGGWEDALRWFDANPTEAMAMGRRARALVDGGLNSESFAQRMMALFDQVLEHSG